MNMASEQVLKITGALSDPTRYNIYRFVLANKEGVSVSQVAEHFEIHPNVARLHLTTLEEANLVISRAEKSGKGGRPGKVYTPTLKRETVSFPPRDYAFVSEVAMRTLDRLGEEAKKVFIEEGYRLGIEVGHRYLQEENFRAEDQPFPQLVETAIRVAEHQDLYPDLLEVQDPMFRFRVRNCPFMEQIHDYPAICEMHQAYLRGILETIGGRIDLIEEKCMVHGDLDCEYIAVKLP